ncbi:MAG: hypothetical protein ACYS8W_10040 [Planctomycetota bacterium]|jgi:hypothetical protein
MTNGISRIIWASVLVLGLAITFPGCGGGGSSNKVPSTGTGTNPTGTGTGTGTNPNAIVKNFAIGTYENTTTSFRESLASRIQGEISTAVWDATHGQMYFGNITIKNQNTDRNQVAVVIDPPDSLFVRWTPQGQAPANVMGWGLEGFMGLGGEFPVMGWLHEWCHSQLGRNNSSPNNHQTSACEEYDCSICAMARYNYNDYAREYCDSSNCSQGYPCWDNVITKKFPSWQHPASPSGAKPQCTVTVE